jgi:small subunit ribosomal protein S1
MRKEDGTNAKVEETLDFVVIEFNKDGRKIVVSHTRTFEEGDDTKPTKKGGKGNKASASSAAVKQVNQNSEKSTLGDLDALAELKQKMEGDK